MSVLQEMDRVLSSEIVPTPPMVMLKVMEAQRDPDSGLSALVEAVSLDPGLAAKLIATANSPVYRRDREVTTVDLAVGQIGSRSVITLALAHSITASFPKSGAVGGVRLDEFWRRSLITGVAARSLANELDPVLREEAFFVGLMSDLGRLALADSLSERYEAVARQEGGWPSMAVEESQLGMSSVRVTAELLRRWQLPELFSNAIDAIGEFELDAKQERRLSDLARTAVAISGFFTGNQDGFAYRTVIGEMADLGIDRGDIDVLLDNLHDEVADMARQLDLGSSGFEAAEILQRARAELIELTLATDVELQSERSRREQLEADNRELEERALRDGLTDLPNRRAFDDQLDQQIRLRYRAAETFGKPMGVVMIDLDHFKSVNDTYGHQIGDEVLRQVAKVLEVASRTEEVVARYGGEEFVMLAPMATVEELEKGAERLRMAVSLVQVELEDGGVLEVTASFGVASMHSPADLDGGARVLEAADKALYEAKHAGRNRVCCASELVT